MTPLPSAPSPSARFATTRWSLVFQAKDNGRHTLPLRWRTCVGPTGIRCMHLYASGLATDTKRKT